MSLDPVAVLDALEADAQGLDWLTKAIGDATGELVASEEAFDVLYDAIAEGLKDEMAEQGRKGDPAEHYITTVTRRQHRAEYQRWRRAKRQMEMLERQLKAKTAALSGRQSELRGLADEAGAQGRLNQRPLRDAA